MNRFYNIEGDLSRVEIRCVQLTHFICLIISFQEWQAEEWRRGGEETLRPEGLRGGPGVLQRPRHHQVQARACGTPGLGVGDTFMSVI